MPSQFLDHSFEALLRSSQFLSVFDGSSPFGKRSAIQVQTLKQNNKTTNEVSRTVSSWPLKIHEESACSITHHFRHFSLKTTHYARHDAPVRWGGRPAPAWNPFTDIVVGISQIWDFPPSRGYPKFDATHHFPRLKAGHLRIFGIFGGGYCQYAGSLRTSMLKGP
jgi:hypothetical protein